MWIEYANHHGVWSATKHSIVYFDTSVTPLGPWPCLPQTMPGNGSWICVDLSECWCPPPEDTGHIGLRVWTMLGGPPGTVMNITVAFRSFGDTVNYGGAAQAHGATERQQTILWVPVSGLKFEYCAAWQGPTTGCTYGVNMELMEYLR